MIDLLYDVHHFSAIKVSADDIVEYFLMNVTIGRFLYL